MNIIKNISPDRIVTSPYGYYLRKNYSLVPLVNDDFDVSLVKFTSEMKYEDHEESVDKIVYRIKNKGDLLYGFYSLHKCDDFVVSINDKEIKLGSAKKNGFYYYEFKEPLLNQLLFTSHLKLIVDRKCNSVISLLGHYTIDIKNAVDEYVMNEVVFWKPTEDSLFYSYCGFAINPCESVEEVLRSIQAK